MHMLCGLVGCWRDLGVGCQCTAAPQRAVSTPGRPRIRAPPHRTPLRLGSHSPHTNTSTTPHYRTHRLLAYLRAPHPLTDTAPSTHPRHRRHASVRDCRDMWEAVPGAVEFISKMNNTLKAALELRKAVDDPRWPLDAALVERCIRGVGGWAGGWHCGVRWQPWEQRHS